MIQLHDDAARRNITWPTRGRKDARQGKHSSRSAKLQELKVRRGGAPTSPIIGTERRLDRKAALKAAGLSAVASSSIFARFFLCRSCAHVREKFQGIKHSMIREREVPGTKPQAPAQCVGARSACHATHQPVLVVVDGRVRLFLVIALQHILREILTEVREALDQVQHVRARDAAQLNGADRHVCLHPQISALSRAELEKNLFSEDVSRPQRIALLLAIAHHLQTNKTISPIRQNSRNQKFKSSKARMI